MEEEKFVPSEEQVDNYRGVKAMPFIIGNEAFEKLGTLGASSNLMIYLTTVFNMKSFHAVMLLNIFSGTTNLAPLLGAYLADSYLGRYKTLAFASVSSLSGMMVLTMTAMLSELHPPECDTKRPVKACVGPSTAQLGVLYIGFGLLAIGSGGIRPCNLPFGADQFNPATESGKRGMNSFFNWYFFTLTCAMMVAGTAIVYVQSNVSWSIGLGIPTGLMCIAVALFFLGSKLYVKVKPQGSSPFSSMAQVVVAALKKRHLELPSHPSCLFEHFPTDSINLVLPYTDQFRFLDKAAIVTAQDRIKLDGSAANPWRLCSVQQVEEMKCVVRLMPISASSIVYHTAMTQVTSYVILQALQSDRHVGNTSFLVPAASYLIVSMLSLTIWIAIYDRVVVPILRKITGIESGITVLQRIGVGLVISICTMLVSALVERKRRSLALPKPAAAIGGATSSSMSAMWFIPQLTLAGLSEAFNSVGMFELFYKQFPENMRTVAGSLFFLGQGFSNYLSGSLVFVVHRITSRAPSGNWLPEDLNKGKLDYFYYLIAAIGVVNFCYFLLCARWYKYKAAAGTTFEATIETKQPTQSCPCSHLN